MDIKKILQIVLSLILGIALFNVSIWLLSGLMSLLKLIISLLIFGGVTFLSYKFITKYLK